MQVSSKSRGGDPKDFGKHVPKLTLFAHLGLQGVRASAAVRPIRQKPFKNAGFIKKPWGWPRIVRKMAETDARGRVSP